MSAFAREVELSLLVNQQGEEIIKLRAENEALKNYLRIIVHATAPTPTGDGGYHENAYSIATTALRGEGEK